MSRSLDLLYSGTNTTSGLITNCNYLLIIKTMEKQIETWFSQIWSDDLDSKL